MTIIIGYHNGDRTGTGEPDVQLTMETAGAFQVEQARRMVRAVGMALATYDTAPINTKGAVEFAVRADGAPLFEQVAAVFGADSEVRVHRSESYAETGAEDAPPPTLEIPAHADLVRGVRGFVTGFIVEGPPDAGDVFEPLAPGTYLYQDRDVQVPPEAYPNPIPHDVVLLHDDNGRVWGASGLAGTGTVALAPYRYIYRGDEFEVDGPPVNLGAHGPTSAGTPDHHLDDPPRPGPGDVTQQIATPHPVYGGTAYLNDGAGGAAPVRP